MNYEECSTSREQIPNEAIFVAADEPLLVFSSIGDAELYLEARDVEAGTYTVAYGPTGKPFRIGAIGTEVVISETGEPDVPEEFRTLLVRYLEGIGEAVEPDEMAAALALRVWCYEEEFWAENDPYGDRFSKPMPLWGCAGITITLALIACAMLYGF